MEIIRSTKQEIEDYYNSPALNQSKLKKLLYGPKYFMKEEEDNKADYFIIGSAVDCILTHPEDFYDEFAVIDSVNNTAPSIKKILEAVFEQAKASGLQDKELGDLEELIWASIQINEFQPKWKKETRIEKIMDGVSYYNQLKLSDGKLMLDSAMYDLVNKITNSIKSKPCCFPFSDFGEDELQTMNRIKTIYFQKPIYFNYNGVDCKALLDALVEYIDGSYTIFDLKTTSKRVIDFRESFFKYRYDMQFAWYHAAVGLNEHCQYFNIVESTTDTGTPAAFYVNRDIVQEALEDIDNLMNDYKYYLANGFEVDKEIRDHDGYLTISKNDKDKIN